jgi:hypothetical protein
MSSNLSPRDLSPREPFTDPRSAQEEIGDRLQAIDRKIELHRRQAKEAKVKADEEMAEAERLAHIRAGYLDLMSRV